MRGRIRERNSKVDGKIGACGLMANPAEHPMSPLIHNFYVRRTGVNLARVPFKVENEQVGDAVKGVFTLNILGMNVTVPHKRRVMEFLIDIDGDAKVIGVVNILVRTEHGYRGYSMDAAGLTRAPLGTGIHVDGERCTLIGAGGAAKVVAYVLVKKGTTSIYIMNRNLNKVQELTEYINRLVGRSLAPILPLDGHEPIPQKKNGYLTIQSTNVGMHPYAGNAIIEDRYFYELVHTGVDIVYTPARTRFMEPVEGVDGRAANGLDVLLYQGIIAYELWNPQVRVDEETIFMARQLIQDHLSMPQAKHNLILIGFMGTGGTSVGDCYAREYGLPIISMDQRIEVAAGMVISKTSATRGEEAFRRLETGVLEELLAHMDHSIISMGGGLSLRKENGVLLKKLGYAVYPDVPPETVMSKIGRDVSDRPMLQDGDMESRIHGLLAMCRPVYLEASHVVVDINGRSVEEIVEEIHCRAGI